MADATDIKNTSSNSNKADHIHANSNPQELKITNRYQHQQPTYLVYKHENLLGIISNIQYNTTSQNLM